MSLRSLLIGTPGKQNCYVPGSPKRHNKILLRVQGSYGCGPPLTAVETVVFNVTHRTYAEFTLSESHMVV